MINQNVKIEESERGKMEPDQTRPEKKSNKRVWYPAIIALASLLSGCLSILTDKYRYNSIDILDYPVEYNFFSILAAILDLIMCLGIVLTIILTVLNYKRMSKAQIVLIVLALIPAWFLFLDQLMIALLPYSASSPPGAIQIPL